MLPLLLRATAICACSLTLLSPLAAQEPDPNKARTHGTSDGFAMAIDGSPPPVFPESITRDALGRATVRAIKLSQPLALDGNLDEEVYSEFPGFGGFLQTAPRYREPSTERSEIWFMYDEDNMYITCRCWDSSPPEQWIVNELRRDTNGLRQNDHFGVMFDTFYDRRNGFIFYANPLEARADYSVVDEGGPNTDWNPVWDVKSGRFEGGWTLEMAIPFKSIRYRSGTDQVWGFQLRRSIRRKNEWTYLNPVPEVMAGPQAFNRISSGGTLVGLDLPEASSNVEIKPYGISGLSTDRTVSPNITNDADFDSGVDLKYGVTANLTLDLTLNTDFAQVEVDEQQVNLTRFSLFFPEKREFFLEGRGVFDFGRGGGFFGGGGGGRGRGGNDSPSLFYSRRIGLDRGTVVPIDVGGRLTGKVGPWAIGAMNLQTGHVDAADIGEDETDIEAANFTVVRVKRDVLRRSAIGAIFTNRSGVTEGEGSNQAFGVDAAFAFGTNFQMGGWYAETRARGVDHDNESYQASANYNGDKYGARLQRLKVGEAFDPQVGFRRRWDFDKTSGSLRFSPRPASIAWIRKLGWEAGIDYYEDGPGRMESRSQSASFNLEMESSDRFDLSVSRNYERLVDEFSVGDQVVLPGSYSFTSFRTSYSFGSQRRISGNVSFERGEFYDGTLTSVGVSRGRVVVSDRLSFEPGVTVNRIELPRGNVNQTVLRSRFDYGFTPRMFASALVQYNSSGEIFSSNLRYRWEYRPGSELFLVWTDERDTGPGGTGLRNRALALKVTRLFRL